MTEKLPLSKKIRHSAHNIPILMTKVADLAIFLHQSVAAL